MSKHDTWIELKSDSPYKDIEHLFPEGFPTRDPFPLEHGVNAQGESASLWIVDLDRLSQTQIEALAIAIASHSSVTAAIVLEQAKKNNGFCLNHIWLESISGGAENYRRSIEFADFEKAHVNGINSKDWEKFYQQQYRDWIDGDKEPLPMPSSYKDIDPRFKTLELEQAYKEAQVNKLLNDGAYSVFDVLNGTAIVDVLNQIDSENDWELATD